MPAIKHGLIIDKKVDEKIFPALEHGKLASLHAIVLHRTAGATASGTLRQYKSGTKVGAHFLIAKTGQIYQTAHITEQCWHVGLMYARCRVNHDCSASELKTINTLLHEKGESWHDRFLHVAHHEQRKPYPKRFPTNADSIGIEVVGAYHKNLEAFETLTPHQTLSVKWLVGCIASRFGLDIHSDIYAHGKIAHKEPSEGVSLLEALVNGGAK